MLSFATRARVFRTPRNAGVQNGGRKESFVKRAIVSLTKDLLVTLCYKGKDVQNFAKFGRSERGRKESFVKKLSASLTRNFLRKPCYKGKDVQNSPNLRVLKAGAGRNPLFRKQV